MNVYPFIEAEKSAGRAVERACVLMKVSRSAYYQWREGGESRRARKDKTLAKRIAEIHRASRGTYGAPRVLAQLQSEGVQSSRKRVARLMKEQGLSGRQKRKSKKTTVADPKAESAPDLLGRQFSINGMGLNEVWLGDISYIRTWEGWTYLATVIDLASRRVVGYAVADHMRASLVCEALEMALQMRQPAPGLVFHSDRGSQYTSKSYRELLDKWGVRQSLSRPGQCWDNAVAESFFATLKLELIYRQSFQTKAAVRPAIFEYVEVFYNRCRLHSTLGYRSPAAYEAIVKSLSSTAVPAA